MNCKFNYFRYSSFSYKKNTNYINKLKNPVILNHPPKNVHKVEKLWDIHTNKYITKDQVKILFRNK